MSEKPILFSGPMVRALLCGAKTQTRRLVRVPESGLPVSLDGYEYRSDKDYFGALVRQDDLGASCYPLRAQYGVPGDRLWVREAWGLRRHLDHSDWNRGSLRGLGALPEDWEIDYRADYGTNQESCFWRPGIHMPRWASRIMLEITEVRVEQLQEISEGDAKAEGVLIPVTDSECPPGKVRPLMRVPHPYVPRSGSIVDLAEDELYRAEFAALWDDINEKRGPWASNPWVWVVSFRKLGAKELAV